MGRPGSESKKTGAVRRAVLVVYAGFTLALVPSATAIDSSELRAGTAASASDSDSPKEGPEAEAKENTQAKPDLLSRLKLSGYLHAQYVHDESSVDELTGTGTRNRDQFSIRRGRIKFTYQVLPTARLVIQPDFTTSGVTLKDGYVELTEPWTSWKNSLIAGQFNWPFGFEIGYSSSSREMPERSRVVRALFPGERDRGVQFMGRGFDSRFVYQIALVNGTGTTQSTDFNRRKDFVGRVGGTFGPLTLGMSGYDGTDLVPTVGTPQGVELDKERTGVDFQWNTPLPGLGIRGEYIRGAERGADVDGWYAYAIQRVGKRHQFAIRADEYDSNTSLANNAIFTIGGSYIFHWDANAKIHLAWEHPRLERNDPEDDVVTVRLQYAF